MVQEDSIHSIGVHGLANQKLVVLEVGNDLLGEGLCALLELLDIVGTGLLLLQLRLDRLHVAWTESATFTPGTLGEIACP